MSPESRGTSADDVAAGPDDVQGFSLAQHEVWLDQAAWPGSAHLNIGGGGFVDGEVDVERLSVALSRLVAESEALRLVPLPQGGQRLLAEYPRPLQVLNFTGESDPVAAMRAWWKREMATPFVFDGTPPWRMTLLHGGDRLYCLTIRFHHVVMDGWGTMQVIQRLAEWYNAPEEAAASAYPPESLRSAIAEALAYRASSAFADDASFWIRQLPTLPPPLFERRFAAPTKADGPPPAQVCTFGIRRADYDHASVRTQDLGQSLFTVCLAALAIYLARTCQRTRIVVGVPTLNRSKRFRRLPGMFVGVMPIVIEVAPGSGVGELIARVGATLRAAMRHARYPLSEIGRALQVIRQGRDGLFDVLFSFERQDYTLRLGDAPSREPCQHFSGLARYPLGVTLCEFHAHEDLRLIFEASTACFAPGHAELLGPRLWQTVTSLLDHLDEPVENVDILPAAERWAVTEGIHQGLASVVAPQPFIALFEHQARLNGHAPALLWDGGLMDYRTLAAETRRLASRLADVGVAHGAVVAIACERSPELIVAILAVARAGGAFLPLDVEAPDARLIGILAESGALVLLMGAAQRDRLAASNVRRLVIAEASLSGGRVELPPLPTADDLAYVLYTSGSTGRPKGVAIDHAALTRRLAWLSRAWGIQPEDRSALATQISFDPSLIELCLPLIHGASIALPPPGRQLPESLVAFAIRHGVSFMAFVPSTLRRFCDGIDSAEGLRLRVACCGGEVLPPEVARRFMRLTGARLFNVYGPTETAIFATAWPCDSDESNQPLPIGRPIDDTRVAVLDEVGRPVPFFVVGEIYLGGVVTRGYLNRRELDADALVPDPVRPGACLYRTGDLGWLAPDGSLYFAGRRDRQLKLRGYRIEPGEIEAQLAFCAGVSQAAVKTVEIDGRQELQAWVAMPSGGDVVTLRNALRQRLPDYMLPSALTLLSALPETASGKIDYDRLEPVRRATGGGVARPPSGRLETDLLALWEKALQRHPLNVCDDFFDVGGDSLAAVDILAGVARLTGRRLPLYQLTEHATVEKLAALLASEPGEGSLIQPLGDASCTGGRPLYLAASGYGDFGRFSTLADALGPAVAVHMLQPPSHGEFADVGELAALYAERIAQRPDAGGWLAGFSVAGLFALETCRQLRQRGIPVRGLILIDTLYPGRAFRAARLWSVAGWLVRVLRLHNLNVNGRRLGSLFSDPGLLAQVRAIADYHPAPMPAQVVLIKSAGMLFWQSWAFRGWRRLFGETLQERVVPGMHGSMFDAGRVDGLAEAIVAACEAGEGKVST